MPGPIPARVLVVDDDASTRAFLAELLTDAGYAVDLAGDEDTACKLADAARPDLVLLDVRLDAAVGGLRIAPRLREAGDPAILFLSGAGSLSDKVAGFESGGDDYLTKPFEPEELLARMTALLRRRESWAARIWQIADLVVDESAHRVTRAGEPVELTPLEFALLAALGRRLGHVISKEQLLREVWGYDRFDVNLVEVHMSSLRHKLERSGPRLVHTVRGVGYVIRD